MLTIRIDQTILLDFLRDNTDKKIVALALLRELNPISKSMLIISTMI